MSKRSNLLEQLLDRALANLSEPVIASKEILTRVEFVCRCMANRAGVRLLMACLLGKLDRPEVDPRKPYTEIGTADSFSGRWYDETYITHFINLYQLPCNPTTAFLTPALRNIDRALTTDLSLVGRPREVYAYTLQLLDDVYAGRVSAEDLLTEAIRLLVVIKNEQAERIGALLAGLQRLDAAVPLSSEEVVGLIEQHLKCKNASRLPVLVVAAAYKVVAEKLGERTIPLMAHNAADAQTGSLGDLEITSLNNGRILTSYEMKLKRVTIDDVDRALQKVSKRAARIDNYIFITTDVIEEDVKRYADSIYRSTGGIEVAILDCLEFLRSFLHIFHRLRIEFLDAYQEMVLAEPDSAVSKSLKETFLLLRCKYESGSGL